MDSYKITFQSWDKIAERYEEKFMNLDLYNDTYDLFCRLIEKQNAKVFEIGCGPGNVTKYLLTKRPDLIIAGIDVSPNMIKLAKKNNPLANFEVMDCREIDKLSAKYDAVMCGFCLPYLSKNDCEKLIRDCSFLLNSGGIIYLSAIEGDYNASGYEADSSGQYSSYVYYHSEDHLTECFRKNNFELLSVERKSYMKTDEVISSHLILIARKPV
ncbi:MAG: class I SAM-dependent DNA methyltransferase [Bacteroidia bacterium]